MSLLALEAGSRGALRQRCSENILKIYRRTPMSKCDFNKLQSNFIEITFRHRCSPVNLLHIFRITFSKNTSGWLFLLFASGTWKMLIPLSFKEIIRPRIGQFLPGIFYKWNWHCTFPLKNGIEWASLQFVHNFHACL